MSINRLAIVTQEYPTAKRSVFPFVEQFAFAMAEAGVAVDVVCPLSLTRQIVRRRDLPGALETRISPGGGAVRVHRPRYISLSDQKAGPIDCAMLTLKAFERATLSAFLRQSLRPDAIYGHFISMGGLGASAMGTKFGIPAFLGYGESEPSKYAMFSKDFLRERLAALSGVISVSTDNKRILVDSGLIADESRVGVFPNGVDEALFHPGERAAARAALGLPGEDFIVAFVGSFIPRKGVSELCRALDGLEGVSSLFIGEGALRPTHRHMLFTGPLPHAEIGRYLRAADIFVLPTKAEGCCNAVVEALACGLPVVSSNLPFNFDVLDDANALLVDPADAEQIARAVAALRDDPALRARLAQGALARARTLKVSARARAIRAFMEARIAANTEEGC